MSASRRCGSRRAKPTPATTGARELCIVVVSGRVTVASGDVAWRGLGERASPFEDVAPHAAYLPPGRDVRITGETDAEIALCTAPAAQGRGAAPDRALGHAAHRPAGKDANLHTSRNEAARLLSVSARSVASASAVLDKADPAVVKAVEQGRVTVSCATEIIKLNLDSEDTNELMTLPQPDIPRNVERLKKEAKRKEAFERMTPQELEALADADTSDADNHAVIAAVAKCRKVMRDLKPRLILCVALELKDWAELLGANQPHDEEMRA